MYMTESGRLTESTSHDPYLRYPHSYTGDDIKRELERLTDEEECDDV